MRFTSYLRSVFQPREEPHRVADSTWVVSVSEEEVSCEKPDGTTDNLRWDQLEAVWLVTTEESTESPDVLWVLDGRKDCCVIPQGARGEERLLERLQRLPGFKNQAVIEAAASRENRKFECWNAAAADGRS
jgi:hypothetical protein